jgi:hypothetical protein
MVEFARQIGATRAGKPYWYAVAEHLAAQLHPDILAGEPGKSPGRPKGRWADLFIDVRETQRRKRCGIEVACGHLSRGYMPWRVTRVIDGKVKTLCVSAGLWKGKNLETLAQRFHQHVRECRETFKIKTDGK